MEKCVVDACVFDRLLSDFFTSTLILLHLRHCQILHMNNIPREIKAMMIVGLLLEIEMRVDFLKPSNRDPHFRSITVAFSLNNCCFVRAMKLDSNIVHVEKEVNENLCCLPKASF